MSLAKVVSTSYHVSYVGHVSTYLGIQKFSRLKIVGMLV